MPSLNSDQSVNRYVPLNLVGTGGMAEVYKCRMSGKKGFEKLIVLKRLLPSLAKDKEVVANFIAEAKLAALLQHENIAHIYDFGEIDDSYFIAMEYLFGKDLHTVMQRARETKKPMKAEHALLVASKICEAMAYAHSLKDLQGKPLNIIHRDLSPHNIFITYEGKVKIIDFGIAKAELFDNLTKAGMVKGKVSYMSPEQLVHEKIDLRSDIFSIGILLYEMLSGTRMYIGDTATLIRKCMQVDYQRLEDITPNLQPPIYKILHKALQRNRDKRYHSCESMGADIDDCLFSIAKKPKSHMLKAYINDLFDSDYSTESSRQTSTLKKIPVEHDKTVSSNLSLAVVADGDRTIPHDSLNIYNSSTANDPPGRNNSKLHNRGRILIGIIVLLLSSAPFRTVNLTENDNIALIQQQQPAATAVATTTTTTTTTTAAAAAIEPPERNDNKIEQIDKFLLKAKSSLNAVRLTRPKGDSAYNYYQKVLNLEPDNENALAGLQQIINKYSAFTDHALNNNNFNKAAIYIHTGLSSFPQNKNLLLLQKKFVAQKQQTITLLAEKAQISLDNNNLTTPENDCAYKYYLDIQAIEKENPIAIAGLQKISDRYAALTEEAYSDLDIKKARFFIEKGLIVTPDHFLLRELQADLTMSTPELFFKNIQKGFSALLK